MTTFEQLELKEDSIKKTDLKHFISQEMSVTIGINVV